MAKASATPASGDNPRGLPLIPVDSNDCCQSRRSQVPTTHNHSTALRCDWYRLSTVWGVVKVAVFTVPCRLAEQITPFVMLVVQPLQSFKIMCHLLTLWLCAAPKKALRTKGRGLILLTEICHAALGLGSRSDKDSVGRLKAVRDTDRNR